MSASNITVPITLSINVGGSSYSFVVKLNIETKYVVNTTLKKCQIIAGNMNHALAYFIVFDHDHLNDNLKKKKIKVEFYCNPQI